MKKLLLLPLIAVIFICCKSEGTDVRIPTKFKVIQLSDSIGNNYTVKVTREVDTTWVYARVKNDTLKDADGKPVKDKFDNLIIKRDTTYTPGLKTGKYYLLDTLLLPGVKNKLFVDVETNARWLTIAQTHPNMTWLLPQNAGGGGDGTAIFNVAAGRARQRSKYAADMVVKQTILTRDSMVMYLLVIDQKAFGAQ